jgi:lysophospholipase
MNGEAVAALYPTPGNAIPPGVAVTFIRASDGTRLRTASWQALDQARGTVVLLQGRTEAIEKYFETVGELRARSLAVATLDWRGQGGSARALADPLKGHVGDFSEYLDDLDSLMSEVVEPTCPRPHYVLAHSMGGLIALHALYEWPKRFACLVTTAPLLGIRTPLPTLVRFLARLGPAESFVPGGARFNPLAETFEENPVTRDPHRFARTVEIFRAQPTRCSACLHPALRARSRHLFSLRRPKRIFSSATGRKPALPPSFPNAGTS